MSNLLESAKLFVGRNGSTILTCMAGVGLGATAYLSAKATPKAMNRVEEAKKEKGEELTKMEVAVAAAPAYIPPVVTGVATLACMFGANTLNKRQQASLVSAYALVENSYRQYKKKVEELYGENANEKITSEIAKDDYEDCDIEPSGDKRLFYDEFSNRYFEATLETVNNAEYQINRDLSMRDYATVNEFYEYLGIEPIEGGDDLGWSSGSNFDYYWQSWIDFMHHKVIVGDDLECIIITMFGEPTLGWDDFV